MTTFVKITSVSRNNMSKFVGLNSNLITKINKKGPIYHTVTFDLDC